MPNKKVEGPKKSMPTGAKWYKDKGADRGTSERTAKKRPAGAVRMTAAGSKVAREDALRKQIAKNKMKRAATKAATIRKRMR